MVAKVDRARTTVGIAFANAPIMFDAIAKVRAERSLLAFIELFWPIVEPRQPFAKGWVQEVICTHLEAVTDEKLFKLLINVPPGMSKSTIVGVFWAAWEWGPKQRPDLRYISWSYSLKLTVRDNGLCRKIIESPLYQRLWGQCEPCRKRADGAKRCKPCETDRKFRLDGDTNAKELYRNDWGGFRQASSVGGAGVGLRADRLIFDDPHSVQGVESDAERMATTDWFAGTLPSRVRNTNGSTSEIRLPEWVRRAHGKDDDDEDDARATKSATIGIMQRVHLMDVSGVILATPELGYEHVMIEMEYLGDKHPARAFDPDLGRVPSPPSTIGYEDPRKARLASVPHDVACADDDPELAWWRDFANVWVRIAVDLITLAFPERYPRHEVETLKVSLLLKSGSNAVEAQLGQWPQEVGGDFFPRDLAKYIDEADLLPPSKGFVTRGWDLASTEDDPSSAATVGVRGYLDTDNRVIIEDCVKTRAGPDGVDALMRNTADDDGFGVRQDVPRDPGQAGKYQINAMIKGPMMGHAVDHSPEQKSKTTRAYPLSSQWKIGNVYIVRRYGDGVDGSAATAAAAAHTKRMSDYLRIMSQFPVGTAKDEIDATTRMLDSQVRADAVRRPMSPRSIKLSR